MSREKALKDLIRGGGAVFLTMMVGYVLVFVYKLLLSRGLGPSDFGLFEMAFTILNIAVVFAGLGLFSGIKRYFPSYDASGESGKIKGYYRLVVWFQFVAGVVVSLALALFARSITSFFGFDDVFVSMLYVVSFAVLFKVFTKSFYNVFLAYKKVLIGKGGREVVENVVLVVGAVVIVWFDLDVFWTSVLLLLSFVFAVLYYLIFFGTVRKRFKDAVAEYEVKRWVKYSLPLLFAGIISYVLSWTDNFVIGRFLTSEDLGVYAIAFSVAYYVFLGSKLFSSVFLPVLTDFYENKRNEFIELFMVLRRWAMMFSFVIGAVFIVYAEYVLRFVFGEAYVDGALSLQVLTAFFIVATYFYYSSKLLHLEEETDKILYGDVFVVVINLALTIYLVGLFGIVGAAIGSGFSYLLLRYVFHLYSKRFVRFSNDYVFLFKMVFVSFFSVLVTFYVTRTLFDMVDIHFLFFIGLSGVLYALLLYLGLYMLKVFKEGDMIILDEVTNQTGIQLEWVKQWLLR